MNDKNENIDFFDIETLTTEEKAKTTTKNETEHNASAPSNWQEILKDMQGGTAAVEQQPSPEVETEPAVVEEKAVPSPFEEAFSMGSDNYEIKPIKRTGGGKGFLIFLLILVLLAGGVFALQYTEIIDLPFLEFIDNLKK